MDFEGNLARLSAREQKQLGRTIPAHDLAKLEIINGEVFATRIHALLRDYYPVIEQSPPHIAEMLIQLEGNDPDLLK